MAQAHWMDVLKTDRNWVPNSSQLIYPNDQETGTATAGVRGKQSDKYLCKTQTAIGFNKAFRCQ